MRLAGDNATLITTESGTIYVVLPEGGELTLSRLGLEAVVGHSEPIVRERLHDLEPVLVGKQFRYRLAEGWFTATRIVRVMHLGFEG